MKNLKRSIALGLILILSLTLLVACGTKLSGKYYMEGLESSYLEFVDGSNCKMVTSLGLGIEGDTDIKDIKYKVSGKKITLTIDGVKSEGTIDGDKIDMGGIIYKK